MRTHRQSNVFVLPSLRVMRVTGQRLTWEVYLGMGVCIATVEVKRMEQAGSGRNMLKLDEMLFEGKEGRSMARSDAQFTIDGAQVRIDGARADDQDFRNLSIGESPCHQA